MELKPGARLRSVTDVTEVVVVRAPADPVDVRCGGHPMVAIDAVDPAPAAVDPAFEAGTLLGKRYSDEDLGLELLCTKGGTSSLSVGSDVLEVKGVKPLPASD
jgi:hypothetical protein